MDDWNDFGAVPPPNPRHLPPTSHPDLFVPLSHSSASSSVSDSSVANLNDDDDDPPTPPPPDSHSSAPVSHPSPASSTTASAPASAAASAASARPTSARERSFIPSFPFLKPRRDRSASTSDDFAFSALRPPHAAHRPPDLAAALDHVSAGSDSDTHEPQSVRLPPHLAAAPLTLNPPVRPPALRADLEDPPAPPTPPRGDLDDVPENYELNIEGFRLPRISSDSSAHADDHHQRHPNSNNNNNNNNNPSNNNNNSHVTSSFLRFPDKCYTKLEVITAKDVRSLLIFFNWFILAALIYTIMLLISVNTVHKRCYQLFFEDPRIFTTQQLERLQLDPNALDNCGFEPRYVQHSRLSQSRLHPSLLFNPLQTTSRQRPIADPDALPPPVDPDAIDPDAIGSDPDAIDPDAIGFDPDAIGFDPDAIGFDPDAIDTFATPDLSIWRWTGLVANAYQNVSHYTRVIFSIFFFILGALYIIRIFSQGARMVTHEQLWVVALIFCAVLYYSAIEGILRILEDNNIDADSVSWITTTEEVVTIAREASFSVITFFYVWANLHSYRILDPLERLTFRRFYLPKLSLLVPVTAFLAVTYKVIPVQLTEIPMMSAPIFIFAYGEFNIIPVLKAELAASVVKSLIDLLLLLIIVREARITFRVLENAPYMKYRTKRVGFRFFLYINFVFYTVFFVLQFLLIFGKPKGDLQSTITWHVNFARVDVLQYMTVGPDILLAGYILVTAYVHLPTTSVGIIKGWFIASELANLNSTWSKSEDDSDGMTSVTRSADDDFTRSTIAQKGLWTRETWVLDDDFPSSIDNDTELQYEISDPVTYRMKESKDQLQIKANCFTMQTHVIMFNFAWYVYYYGTAKLNTFHPTENPLPFNFRIQAHAKCEASDTQALVVDCTDRIIVTFKGTTSKRNVQTSLHMSHHRLPEVVCCNIRGHDESERLKRLFGVGYLHGKVHRGFAAAYLSVADEVVRHVQILRGHKLRPVFLTGHSLGGALATICSLDLWVKLNLSRREIFVSTFGSPRVGNQNFVSVYNQVVPLHWRIVVHPDMIAKMPFHGYKHVGKKVVLTAQGDMLLDPNTLSRRPWTGEAAGFAYHRKAAYMLAMRAWCTRHHGMTYTPVFWPFPVRQEDERRFAGAFDVKEATQQREEKADRIAIINAMVDQLGKTEDERVNTAVVEKWARLARYKLLKQQLQTKRTRGGR